MFKRPFFIRHKTIFYHFPSIENKVSGWVIDCKGFWFSQNHMALSENTFWVVNHALNTKRSTGACGKINEISKKIKSHFLPKR